MSRSRKKPENRYINDLRRFRFSQKQVLRARGAIVPVGVSGLVLAFIAITVGVNYATSFSQEYLIVLVAAGVGVYMAMNIGANDVANNMGPAVGGKVLTVTTAIIIAAICEMAGALLAGGDVVRTVSNGIITPGETVGVEEFRTLMLAALLAAAVWINVATIVGAPVSTTHSIVGGILGSGIAAAGLSLVNWVTVAKIVGSWVVSPVLGAAIAAALLLFIKVNIINAERRLEAAARWVPVLIALMAAAFAAFMALKGLRKIWTPSAFEVCALSITVFVFVLLLARPYVAGRVRSLGKKKAHVYRLFNAPLVISVALLSFAHGANDVANAVGPLAAIISTFGDNAAVASKVGVPFWVMTLGAFGIAFGLIFFGSRLITVVGEKITRLNAPRAYCVALSSAVTVLIATALGLPVSSTHIAVGAVFGVGFLREATENPNRRKLRPGHKLNDTAEDAFNSRNQRGKRRLVRRKFVGSIVTAWLVTVPVSAILSASFYGVLRLF